jgi:hypothetical protein
MTYKPPKMMRDSRRRISSRSSFRSCGLAPPTTAAASTQLTNGSVCVVVQGMNGYRPIVELMNTNFGIYGLAEISSAGNTYATTGGQFLMPMTIIGAGGTAPNQVIGTYRDSNPWAHPPSFPVDVVIQLVEASAVAGWWCRSVLWMLAGCADAGIVVVVGAGRGALSAVPRVRDGHPGPQDLHGRLPRRRLRAHQGHDPRQRPRHPLPAGTMTPG